MTEETKIPAHRHAVTHRSAEPRFVAGGNDDRAAKPRQPKAKKPRAKKPTPAPAPAPAPSTDTPA